jgi:hypothetical protein
MEVEVRALRIMEEDKATVEVAAAMVELDLCARGRLRYRLGGWARRMKLVS